MNKLQKFLIITAATLFLAAFLNVAFQPYLYTVNGHSMFPTIFHGDICVTINKTLFMSHEYKRYDVISFREENGSKHVIKRILGLPGEHIEIKDSVIYIDGDARRSANILLNKMDETRDLILGPDEYYMLGDNRPYSYDSRIYGPIKKWQIRGKVWFRWRALTGL